MILLQREIDAGSERTEHQAVRVAALMRGIPVTAVDRVRPGDLLPPGSLRLGVLPVGTVRFILDTLTVNGLPLPPPVDYPDVLRAHLHRRVWLSTPAEACRHPQALVWGPPEERVWAKPAGHRKAFVCGLFPADSLSSLEDPVWCAQPVRWQCEWRYYVSGGRILWGERYDPDGPDDAPRPDPGVVDTMVATYEESGTAPAGYALDAGVLDSGETALVEVNDGYALGFYGSVITQRAERYLDLLEARFSELVRATASWSKAGGVKVT